MAQKFIEGSIIETPKGKIRILSRRPGKRLPNGKKVHPRAIIEFLKTGTVIDVQTTNLTSGKFHDHREPTVYGVGYIGSPITIPERGSGSIVRRVYDLWANMLKRVYGDYKGKYEGCSVDVRWHNFTTFLNTIHEVPCYTLWEENKIPYHLDKDIRIEGNKVYSRDTCTFVPAKVNIHESSMRRWHGN